MNTVLTYMTPLEGNRSRVRVALNDVTMQLP